MRSSIKTVFFGLILLLVSQLFFCNSSSNNAKPKLVVMITLDQFRADYLQRYDEALTGGLKRLKDNGWRYDKAIVDHAPTLSFPGHTSIFTGAYPKTHGIPTNARITESGRRKIIFQDDDQQVLGFPGARSFTPKITKVTGMADWLRVSDPESRSVSINTTMTALCYGGKPQSDKTKNHVYWIEASAGKFVTSTYYRDEYPDWLVRFNEEVVPQYKEMLVWENSVPAEYFHLARRDNAAYEFDGVHTTFPHNIGDFYKETDQQAVNRYFSRYNPYATEALFALGKECIKELELGQRNSTDCLAVSVGITDRIGHDFGPQSLEQLDIVLRLDRELGKFLKFLDSTIGKNYTVVLTGDHGAPNIAEYELEQGRPAKRVTEIDIKTLLADIEKFIDNYSGPEEKLTSLIAEELEKSDFVAKAMTPDDLAGTVPADRILKSYRNSYIPGFKTTFPLWTNEILYGNVSPKHPGHYGIIVEYIPNGQLYTARSAHATSYSYDQEVPIVFMGAGVKAGISKGAARTIDIAPTLAQLAGIKYPETVDGKILDLW
ncbi:alkaline phosphatase family protein [candidate division KSB1 bacterium]